MTVVRIAPIVEGDGEVAALPVLLRRVVQQINPAATAIVPRGFRHPSGSMRRTGGMERAIETVCALYRDHAIMVLIDSDDDCPKHVGQELAERARAARPGIHVSVVLAHREYESWFLAAAESLSGRRNLTGGLTTPPEFEQIRNAKGWLTKQMGPGLSYAPTQDQAALSALFDLETARSRSRSFRKLWKEVETMMHRADSTSA